MATTKKDPATELTKELEKKFKKSIIHPLSEGLGSEMQDVIPTGISVLDKWVFGCGGLPGNKIGELYGEPDTGKTSLGCIFLGAAQRAGGIAILHETENTLNKERVKAFCDIDKVLLAEPPTTEDWMEQMQFMLDKIPRNVGPNVIVLDSLAASDTADDRIGGTSRLMAKELPRLAKKLAKKRASVVVINQTRAQIGVMFGDPISSPGGKTLKFMASWRLRLWPGKKVKKGTDYVGIYTTIKAEKNKIELGWSQRKAKLRLDFATGWHDKWSVVNFAKDRKLIKEGAKLNNKTYEEALAKLNEMDGWYNGKILRNGRMT